MIPWRSLAFDLGGQTGHHCNIDSRLIQNENDLMPRQIRTLLLICMGAAAEHLPAAEVFLDSRSQAILSSGWYGRCDTVLRP